MFRTQVFVLSLFLMSVLLATATAESRTWTSRDGKYRFEAELIKFEDGVAHLKGADGRVIAVPFAKLSAVDQQFIRPKPSTDAAKTPQSFDEFIAASRWALGVGRISDADQYLSKAESAASSEDERKKASETKSLRDLVSQFWSAAISAGREVTAGSELEIGETIVVVVESENGRLVIRALGQNRRFMLDRPETIPSSLATALAKLKLAGSGADKVFDAFESLDPGENNKQLWAIAAGTRPTSPMPPRPEFASPSRTSPSTPTPFASGGDSRDDATASETSARAAMPEAAKIAAKTIEVHELFADDFKNAKDAKSKYELAKKLFKIATDSQEEDPAACVALVIDASRLTAEVGDARGSMDILDWLEKNFDDDQMVVRRAEALESAAKKVIDAQTTIFIADRGSKLIDEAIAADDYDSAAKALQTALVAARRTRDRNLIAEIQRLDKAIGEQRRAFGKIAAAKEKLKSDPNDADANMTLAIYYCATKGDWKKGLPHLAKAGDADLASAASGDAESPKDAGDQYALGDAWWKLSEGAKDDLAPHLKLRAAHWYEQSLQGITGLKKAKAQKRIDEASEISVASSSGGGAKKPAGVPDDAIAWKGNWYWFSTEKSTFDKAHAHATSIKGRLLVISSAEENEFVTSNLKDFTFLGIYKNNRSWVNSLGRPQQLFNWKRGQPSNGSREKNATIHPPEGFWDDHNTGESHYYVIEWGKE